MFTVEPIRAEFILNMIKHKKHTYFQNLSTFRVPSQNIFEKLDQWWRRLSKPSCRSQSESTSQVLFNRNVGV